MHFGPGNLLALTRGVFGIRDIGTRDETASFFTRPLCRPQRRADKYDRVAANEEHVERLSTPVCRSTPTPAVPPPRVLQRPGRGRDTRLYHSFWLILRGKSGRICQNPVQGAVQKSGPRLGAARSRARAGGTWASTGETGRRAFYSDLNPVQKPKIRSVSKMPIDRVFPGQESSFASPHNIPDF